MICAGACILSLNLFIFSLPFFGLGIWPQSETAIAALHFCGAASAFGLTLIHLCRPYLVRLLYHPIVIIPLCIGLISIALTPLYDFPIRNLLGSVRTGEGAFWWLDWSMLSAAGFLLCRFKLWRYILCITATIGFLAIFGLYFIHHYTGRLFTPYFYPDFMALQITALLPVLCVFLRRSLHRPTVWIGLYILLNCFLIPTENKVAIAFGFIGFGFFLALWFLAPLRNQLKIKVGYSALALIAPLSVFILLVLAKLPLESGYYTARDSGFVSTLISRAYLMEVILNSLISNPLNLLIGQGWGTFIEHLPNHLPTTWLDFTQEGGKQWDGLRTDHFHSHNTFIEILYASGIVNMALLYIYFISLGVRSSRTFKLTALIFSAGAISLISFWFLLPLNVPFLTLGAALIANRKPVRFLSEKKYVHSIARVALPIVSGLTLAGAIVTLDTAKSLDHYMPHTLEAPPSVQKDCPMEYADFGTGGLRLSKMLLGRTRYVTSRVEELMEEATETKVQKEIRTELPKIHHLFCQSENYIQHYKPSIRLTIARLMVRGEILISLDPWLDEKSRAYYYKGWQHDLEKWLSLHPSRADLAVPFLLWHLTHEEESILERIALQIYRQNDQDPVGLWFRGIVLLNDPRQSQTGLSFMRKALGFGIERYVPVDPTLKNQLLNAH